MNLGSALKASKHNNNNVEQVLQDWLPSVLYDEVWSPACLVTASSAVHSPSLVLFAACLACLLHHMLIVACT